MSQIWKVIQAGHYLMDSGFHRIDLGDVQVLDFWFQSLSWFPDSKAHDSGFHKQKFPGFQNPDCFTWDETLKYWSGTQISLGQRLSWKIYKVYTYASNLETKH